MSKVVLPGDRWCEAVLKQRYNIPSVISFVGFLFETSPNGGHILSLDLHGLNAKGKPVSFELPTGIRTNMILKESELDDLKYIYIPSSEGKIVFDRFEIDLSPLKVKFGCPELARVYLDTETVISDLSKIYNEGVSPKRTVHLSLLHGGSDFTFTGAGKLSFNLEAGEFKDLKVEDDPTWTEEKVAKAKEVYLNYLRGLYSILEPMGFSGLDFSCFFVKPGGSDAFSYNFKMNLA